MTRGGTTTAYRYDAAGQRIAKQVGSGSTEVTVREGALALGVFTVTGAGAVTASAFHLLAGDRVVGRQPGTGSRRYYHTDLLGSTRAVVEGATVVESYDYDPWGVLLPGRTLGSGTAELFTGKERDAESGLDYFGARYYLAALGRWAQVDPAPYADRLPAWSPYVYVFDAPTGTVDPDGRCGKTGEDPCPSMLRGALLRTGQLLEPAQGPLEIGGYAVMALASGGGALEGIGAEVLALGSTLGSGAGSGILTAGAIAQRVLTRAAVPAAGSAGRTGAAVVRVGQAGEAAVRGVADIGPKVAIDVAGRARIPDGLTSAVLSEVKNVASQGFTQHLRDFTSHASASKLRFDLWVRPSTQLSGPLAQAVANGAINLRYIP